MRQTYEWYWSSSQSTEWVGEAQGSSEMVRHPGEVAPTLTTHNDGHVVKTHYDDFLAGSTQQRLELAEQYCKRTSARKRWEELFQAATREQARSPTGRWSSLMELIGAGQNPGTGKIASRELGLAGDQAQSTTGASDVEKNPHQCGRTSRRKTSRRKSQRLPASSSVAAWTSTRTCSRRTVWCRTSAGQRAGQ